jgi:hypothetical protein
MGHIFAIAVWCRGRRSEINVKKMLLKTIRKLVRDNPVSNRSSFKGVGQEESSRLESFS